MTDPLLHADGAAQAQPDTPADGCAATCQHQDLHAIEAQVFNEKGTPLGDIEVELRKTETEVLSGKTDWEGYCRFDGLSAGSYQLVLPALDQDAWSVTATEALPGSTSTHAATFGPPRAEPPPESQHEVRPGECIVQLAYLHGLLPERLWQYPANQHLWGEKRVQEILEPGEIVVIPAPRLRPVPAEVDTRLQIQCTGTLTEIPLRFLDRFDEPRSQVPCLIRYLVGDDLFGGRIGETDGEGRLLEIVPPSVTTVEITLVNGEDREQYELIVGDLDPIETIRGVQGRLDNLGYPCPLDGSLDETTLAAIRAFQEDRDLEVTGEIDDTTLSELEKCFGS